MAREIARDADQSRSPQYAQVKSALKEIPKGTFLCRENVIQYYIWATQAIEGQFIAFNAMGLKVLIDIILQYIGKFSETIVN